MYTAVEKVVMTNTFQVRCKPNINPVGRVLTVLGRKQFCSRCENVQLKFEVIQGLPTLLCLLCLLYQRLHCFRFALQINGI